MYTVYSWSNSHLSSDKGLPQGIAEAIPKSGPLILRDLKSTMFRSAQYCFQDLNLKFAVRFQTTENIQNTLSTAFTLLWVSNLAGKYFQASTFLIAELVDMTGFDDFSKISVSIHCFAVDFIKITTTGLIQLDLCRKNSVFYTGYGLFIILVFHNSSPYLQSLYFAFSTNSLSSSPASE